MSCELMVRRCQDSFIFKCFDIVLTCLIAFRIMDAGSTYDSSFWAWRRVNMNIHCSLMQADCHLHLTLELALLEWPWGL